MKTLVVVGGNSLRNIARGMFERGEITGDQFLDIETRASMLPTGLQDDVVITEL